MPVQIKIEGIFPEKNVIGKAGDRILDSVKNTLTGTVARRIENAMKERTRGWDQAPTFKSDLTAATNVLSLLVMPAGRGKIKWERVSGGTPPHTITARRAPTLVFQSYRPSTAPGNVYGRSHSRYGPYTRKVSVRNKGIKPRNFEEHIVREEEGWVVRTLRAAVEKAK